MFRTDSVISKRARWILGLLPFVLMILVYVSAAEYLHHQDKLAKQEGREETGYSQLLPIPSEIWSGMMQTLNLEENGDGYTKLEEASTCLKHGELGNSIGAIHNYVTHTRLYLDTAASMWRFTIGMAIASLGIVIGLYAGVFPFVEALLEPLVKAWDKVQPYTLLVILILIFSTGEMMKISLLVIGVLPGIVVGAYLAVKDVPREKFTKAQSLRASEHEIAWSIVMPQIFPKMLDLLRQNFKAAWGYVIVAEGVQAMAGIGYYINLQKRYVAMHVIIPYVIWATVIMFVLDWLFQKWASRFRWVGK